MKYDDIYFLTTEEVIQCHDALLLSTGGLDGYDFERLDGAVQSVPSGYYVSLAGLAAAYVFNITNGHPFFDGNKRTGFVAGIVFLALNGCNLNVDQNKWKIIMEDVAQSKLKLEEVSDYFKNEMTYDPLIE